MDHEKMKKEHLSITLTIYVINSQYIVFIYKGHYPRKMFTWTVNCSSIVKLTGLT